MLTASRFSAVVCYQWYSMACRAPYSVPQLRASPWAGPHQPSCRAWAAHPRGQWRHLSRRCQQAQQAHVRGQPAHAHQADRAMPFSPQLGGPPTPFATHGGEAPPAFACAAGSERRRGLVQADTLRRILSGLGCNSARNWVVRVSVGLGRPTQAPGHSGHPSCFLSRAAGVRFCCSYRTACNVQIRPSGAGEDQSAGSSSSGDSAVAVAAAVAGRQWHQLRWQWQRRRQRRQSHQLRWQW